MAGEAYTAQSVLNFGSAADAAAFVAELRAIQQACPKGGRYTPATRPIPAPVPVLADEGVVVGSYTEGLDGSALFVGRKGSTVVVVMRLLCGNLASQVQADGDQVNVGQIMDVLSQS